MENAALIALSRQLVLRRELDIAANNIANADTTGFKLEHLIVETETAREAANLGVDGPGRFVLDQGVGRDFGQGAIHETGRPLDLALEGDAAFFRIGDPEGGPERYTRDGAFTTDPEGRLVTRQGLPVLDEGGAEIILDSARGQVSIADDGTISQEGEAVGRYANTANEAPVAAPDVLVRQGMLEGSNVDTLAEITRLIEIQRAYESTARLIENANDLSRRAVERLGRAA